MMPMAISVVSFLATFTVIVLVHELGHFIAARKCGVKVYEFSVGFPFSPRLCRFFRHKETEFTLRLLPLGGFVSFSKEGTEDEAKALFQISPIRRAMILAAGPISNVAFALVIFIPLFIMGKHLNFIDALLLSGKTVWAMLSGTAMLLVNALSGNGTLEGISGPVGIAAMAGRAASKGILNLLYFSGVLSLSLGIMNLIPFPALDGGQLLMILAESVRKKPFSPRTYQVATLAGLAVFAVLTVAVTYKDIARLIA
jgi:regulator of sigma E protease